VNAQSDIQTQLATTHSADEVAFIRRVLDAMFETHNTPEREVMAIKFNAGMALSKPPAARASVGGAGETQNGATAAATAANAGIKKDQAEQVLEQLVKDGWLARSRNGYLSLDTRGLMELGGWLVQMYNEEEDPEDVDDDTSRPWQRIKMCEGCKQIITVVSYNPSLYCQVSVRKVKEANLRYLPGPTMFRINMHGPITRSLRGHLFPWAAEKAMPGMQERLDKYLICRRESSSTRWRLGYLWSSWIQTVI
jgi:hypothetical protein